MHVYQNQAIYRNRYIMNYIEKINFINSTITVVDDQREKIIIK